MPPMHSLPETPEVAMCRTCGQRPEAKTARVHVCWPCYWKGRPEEYEAKKEYNRQRWAQRSKV